MNNFRYAVVLGLALGITACNRTKSSDGSGKSEVAPASAVSLNGFEGEIGVAVKRAPTTVPPKTEIPPLTLMIKGDKVRADIPPGFEASQPNLKGYGVLNTPEKKLYLVMDEQKQVIVFDLNQAGEQMKTVSARRGPFGSGKPEGPSKPPPTVTKTGVTDKVAGYGCENWDVAEEKRKVATVCVADQGASWFHLPITGMPTEYAWSLELLDGKHFPLRAIGYGQDGAEEGRVEVTKIEKKPLAAALFDIPPGYKVVDLMTMMQTGFGMGALMAPGLRPGTMPPGGMRPGGMPPAAVPPNRPK